MTILSQKSALIQPRTGHPKATAALGSGAGLPALMRCLADPEADVRRSAADVLGSVGQKVAA